MKISLRAKLTMAFILVLSVAICIGIAINSLYLEKFYLISKEKIMLDIQKEISATIESEDVSDAIYQLLDQIQLTSNIRGVVVWQNSAYSSSRYDTPSMLERLNIIRISGASEPGEIIRFNDKDSGNSYLETWGYLSDGATYLLRMPIISVRESVNISNQFYMYVGLATLVLGSILIYFAVSSTTKPLVQLKHISRKMAEMDFSVKYTGNATDEVGELGRDLNELSTKLENTITELKTANLELQKDIQEKEEIDQMRRDFLSNVTHELKTPISLIQGYAEGVQIGVMENPEDVNYYCEVIIDEAQKMNRMVTKLLSLNQLESGKDQLQLERFDIVELIRGVIHASGLVISQKDVTVIFTEYEPRYVYGDEYKIEEVISNYFSNALNHVDGKKEILIEITPRDNMYCISVENTGKPIPQEDLDKVWEKFYKVDKARTREYGGNGIGLSIVKAIMEAHCKPYGVENTEYGVKFWFCLDASG